MLVLRRGTADPRAGRESRGVYLALQDTVGILSAARGVQQLNRIPREPFLTEALGSAGGNSRMTEYRGGMRSQ